MAQNLGNRLPVEKIWLDPAMTSSYKFYQFWLNISDDDALRFIKIFTLLTLEDIEALGRSMPVHHMCGFCKKHLLRNYYSCAF